MSVTTEHRTVMKLAMCSTIMEQSIAQHAIMQMVHVTKHGNILKPTSGHIIMGTIMNRSYQDILINKVSNLGPEHVKHGYITTHEHDRSGTRSIRDAIKQSIKQVTCSGQ